MRVGQLSLCSQVLLLPLGVPPMPAPARSIPSPPLDVAHPLSFPGGGGGGSLGQPKIFRCGSLCCCVGDCVVGHCHLYPLYSWQEILLTFAEMELDSTTMFPPGTNVMFICSTGEPVLVQIVGHSEHSGAYRRMTYDHDGKTVLHNRASVRRLSLPRAPSPPRPAHLPNRCGPPCGGWGTVTWQPSPRGWWGTVFPGVGNDMGGEGYKV